MAKKVSFLVTRNGEHIGKFETREEADAYAEEEKARLRKFEHQGWFSDASAFRVEVISWTSRIW